MKKFKLSSKRKSSGQVVVLLIIVLVLLGGAWWWLNSNKQASAKEGTDFAHEAIQEITRCAGSQFDPTVTAALIGYLYGKRQAGIALAA